MGTSLTGTTPQDTYDSLIKVTDNGPLSGSLKTLTDGLGNDSALALSTGAASVTGTLNVSGDVSIADKIVHTGDTNTALRFPANDTFTVETAGSERMRISSTGNVGIGTTTLPYKFNVYDTSDAVVGHFAGGSSNYTLVSFLSNESNVYSTSLGSYNSGLLFRTSATDRMYITSSGNVGIGTTAPIANLHVQGTNPEQILISYDSAKRMLLGRTDGYGWISPYTDGVSYDNLILARDGGNIGIGTSTPDSKLNISGGATRGLRIDVNSTVQAFSIGSVGVFGLDAAGVGNGRFIITELGNVGIGVTSPATKLDVSGAINIKSGNTITWGGAYGSGTPAISGNKLSSYLSFFPAGSTSGETMRITNSGQVGVSTTPQDWWSSRKAIEIFQGGAYAGVNAGWMEVWGNSYLDNSATTRYLQTGGATLYQSGNVLGGGAHTFLTAPSGNAGDPCPLVEKVRIDNDGLKFNGDTAASNALDDYEEGTFTATLVPSTSGSITLNIDQQTCKYTKIGNKVSITGFLIVNSVSSPVGGQVNIQGLPFAINNTSGGRGSAIVTFFDAPSYASIVVPSIFYGNSSSIEVIINASLVGASDEFYVSATYFV